MHHAIKQKKFKPCGDLVIGVDKGYSEAFADSEGDFYGSDLGEFLARELKKGIAEAKQEIDFIKLLRRNLIKPKISISITLVEKKSTHRINIKRAD